TSPAPPLTWWGTQWARNNVLSGGAAPDALQGWGGTSRPHTTARLPSPGGQAPRCPPANNVLSARKQRPLIGRLYYNIGCVPAITGEEPQGPGPPRLSAKRDGRSSTTTWLRRGSSSARLVRSRP